tara:strand:+ start:1920 stop:3146 length:1227 start_codon:yes stop_codon:yes gene_type:complete
MNNLISTLVVEALDGNTAQNAIHATSVANSAATGKLAIQTEGVFRAGTYTSTGANDLIKMSAATTMADGTISVMSTSEFKKGDIISSHYTAASSPADATSTVDYSGGSVVKLGGQFFVRLERKDGQGINDTETYSGETVAQIVTAFAARKSAGTTEFNNLTLSDAQILGSSVLNIVIDARDENSGLIISANDNATITNNAPANDVGSLTAARKLEKLGFITQGAYNQYGFPIVNPETSTAAGQDYGIYTIELRKKVGGRFVFETIKVLIQDDEASAQKTVTFIENVLGLSSADLTVPTKLTSITYVTSLADGTAITQADNGDADPFFIKIVGAEIGTTLVATFTSDGSEDVVTEEFAVTATTESFAVTSVNASNFAAGVNVVLDGKLRDSNNNLSDSATTGDTVAIVE